MKKFIISLNACLYCIFAQTPEQIKQAKKVIQETGMSETQARSLAKSKGFTDNQIENAINNERNNKLKTIDNVALPEIGESNELMQQQNSFEKFDNISSSINEQEIEDTDEPKIDFESKAEPSNEKLMYFGYDIFTRNPELFQAASVGAIDPDYLIGPGDEIIVMLWGETQFRQVLTVDREGFVFVPEIGQVFVNGLDLNLLESKLFRVFSQSYASLNPQGRPPTTFLDVSLGNLRPLRIQVIGEVGQPGAYTISPSATLFSALYYFNGPTTLGSLRDIQLIRGGEKITSIDFYDYLLTGKKPKDQKLQLDDVIYIPRRLKTVRIQGEISRSGIYELKPDESLTDLIKIAGDLKITAYLNRAQIDRIVPFTDREDLGMDRIYNDVSLEKILESQEGYPLQDGDHIKIFSILDSRQNVVDLRGAVTRPGSYELHESLKLSELIDKSDGLLGDAYLNRVDIIRTKQDFTEQLVKLDLKKALEGDENNNIELQGLDRVRVYSTTEMVSKTYVSIAGHVKRKGRYALQESMTLYDLIFKAGGFIDQEFRKQAFENRADLLRLNEDNTTRSIISFNLGKLLDDPNSSINIPLKANDIVRIYNKNIFFDNKPVTINGVVRKPGVYNLKTDMTLKDLILEAGGLNFNIYRYRVEVARIDPLNNDLNEYAEVITFNMDEKLSPSQVKNADFSEKKSPQNFFKLMPYDLVSIRPDPYFNYQSQVGISGEVLYPGNYVILSSDEKITNIIDRAGGLLPNAYSEGSTYVRNGEEINISFKEIIRNPKSKLNFRVQSGDEIRIGRKPDIVRILGEVNSPGVHKFVPGKRLKSYIFSAGGLTPDADVKNVWIEYPNGDSKKYNRWSILSPNVKDGSSILIGRLKEEEPFDRTEYAKELTSIIANLAQTITMVILAIN